MIKAIMAVDDEWGFSKNGTMPWPKNTEDLDRFRTTDAQGDMWRDWSEEVQGVGLEYSQGFAIDQRLIR